MRPPIRDDEPEQPLDARVHAGDGDSAKAEATASTNAPSTVAAAADAPADLLEIIDPIPDVEAIDNPFGLSPQELLFVEAYVGQAHFRAAKAYELAGYKTTGAASRANASRMLTRPRIEAAIAARLAERVKAMRIMDGDEALEGISNMGRVDIRKCFPPESSVAKLPDEIADAVKSVTPTKFGYRIEMYDKLRARELMAKAGGKLKETVTVEHSLEDILARSNRPDAEAAQ